LRDINRHFYSLEEADAAMKAPVVKRLLKLMEFRSSYPAFQGVFELQYSNESSIAMSWHHGDHRCELFVDLIFKRSVIRYVDPKTKRMLSMKC
jgi:sucrose phosphorylase